MSGWDLQSYLSQKSRDFWQRPILYPLLCVYDAIGDIRRYEHMPFYIYPLMKSSVSFEDRVIAFIDFLVDAHEESRNKHDGGRNFHARATYTY